jgi:predicted nuclease with TOPRIM domain
MRIERLSIDRYGPLLGRSALEPAPFTVLYGNNERGKSLTIDAICRMLFRKVSDLKVFPGLRSRVEGGPKGEVVLRSREGRYAAPHDGAVDERLGLTSRDLANVFVVRDNALHVQKSFFAEATDRLTGFRRERADAVESELRRHGALTPTGKLSSDKENNQLGERVRSAAQLRDRIEQLLTELQQEEATELDEELVRARARMEELRAERGELDRARRREVYHEARGYLQELGEIEQQLEKLQQLSQEEADGWLEHRETVRRADQDLQDLRSQADEAEAAEEKHRTELASLQERAAPLDPLVARAGESLGLRLQEVNERESEAARWRAVAAGSLAALIATAVLALGGIAAAWAMDSVVADITAVLLTAIFLAVVALQLYTLLTVTKLRAAETRLRQAAESGGFSSRTPEELRQEIDRVRGEHQRLQEQTETAESRLSAAQRERQQLREERIPQREEQRARAAEEVARLQRRSGLETLEAYRERLDEKGRLEQRAESIAATLRARLDTEKRPRPEERGQWEAALARLQPYADAAPNLSYSSARAEAVDAELAQVSAEVDRLEERLQRVREELADIRRQFERLVPDAEAIPCDTVADLGAVKERLAAFETQAEERRRIAATAVEILHELKLEAEQELGELFGQGSALSETFRRITDGRYTTCELERQEGAEDPTIRVRTASGQELRADQLSGGAYDQLYLSVRLALAQALLGGEGGFLILDDPFVRADQGRLRRQLEALRTAVADGWQVLYFTAKQEVLQAVADMHEVAVRELEQYWSTE